MLAVSSTLTLNSCWFSGNEACLLGGGLYCRSGGASLVNCTFIGNTVTTGATGGGMAAELCSATLVGCVFAGNEASGGGGLHALDYASVSLVNCLFTGNSAISSEGGGMLCTNEVVPTLADCTFYGNTSAAGGGALCCETQGSPAVIDNSVFWGNTASTGDQIHLQNATADVTYSCLQGGWTGIGNIDTDPMFTNPDGPDGTPGTADDDLRIAPGSPCIDAGDNLAVPADTLDLDGDGDTTEPTPLDLDGAPRFVDDPSTSPDPGNGPPPVVDMGSYEYQSDCNENGVVDALDIASGTSLDCNENGIPDDCEYVPGAGCPGDILRADMNCDGLRNGMDIQRFVATLVADGYTCQADQNQDGNLDIADVPPFITVLLRG